MISSSSYTQQQNNTSISRNGGIIIKGQTRNSRQPVHLTLVVDTSGSMELEDKLPSVKKSIQLLLTLLSPDDRLSLVTFADSSKTFLNRVTPTPEEREAILYRINNLNADGSTNMSAGLLEARGLVENSSTTRKQGLILLTDGHANIGVHTEEGLTDILKRIQTESPGLSLTTVAYGVDHNAEMLTNLAKVGGGAYNVVKNLEDVATVFGDILGGLISVSAQKVEVQFPPGAEVKTSYRSETDPSGLTTVYVGDIYADAEVTILFKSSPSMGPVRIKGTDMTTLDPIDTIVTPTELEVGQTPPISLLTAQHKQEVVTLLSKVRTSLNPSSLKSDLESAIKRIEDDDPIQDHPLKPILLEDLREALRICERGQRLTQHETVEMAQHSAYLGLSRGLRTTTSYAPNSRGPSRGLRRQVAAPSLSPDDIQAPALAAVTSPFANRMQTQLASVMRTMSSQPQENSQEEN